MVRNYWYLSLQNIENDSDTPVVDFLAVAFTLDDFGSDIAWSTTGSGGKFTLNESGKTKVSDLNN